MSEAIRHIRSHGQRALECSKCGQRMFDRAPQREEMQLHVAECEGYDDPQQRFDVGDRVETSDVGVERLGRGRRYGEVVGFGTGRNDHCVRVQWDELETPTSLAHRFVRPEGYDR